MQWQNEVQRLAGLPLLPLKGKAPINPQSGYGWLGWESGSATPAEVIATPGVTGCGLRAGPACGLICFDLDGATGIAAAIAAGCDPAGVRTWVVARTGTSDRLKVLFRISPEQSALLTVLKCSITTFHDQTNRKREGIEVFHGVGQVVVCGQHPDGDSYCWPTNCGPDAVAPLPEAWMALALHVRDEAPNESRATHRGGTATRTRSSGGEWRKANPCPICGRDSHLACTETRDGLTVVCVDGDTFGFTLRHGVLRPGAVVQGGDGQQWAFIRSTYSGHWAKDLGVFRIDRPKQRSSRRITPMQRPSTDPLAQPTPLASQPAAAPAFDQARLKLKDLLADGCSGSALATKVLELAEEYECHASLLFRVVSELQSEDDAGLQADVELEGIKEAQRLEHERKEFTLELLLPKRCVEPLRYLSTSLQADDLATAMIFLTTMTGALKSGTRIWGDEISFAERPQLWLALIGKSGLGKSPAIRNLGLALAIPVGQSYQHRNVARYQAWEITNAGVAKNQRTPEPDPFVFQVSNYTAGAIVKQFATNEIENLGMLMAVDELAALFSSLNEFQDKAKGSEEQQLLSMFDNNGDHQIRVKDGYRSYSEAQLSIIGGIQPLVFDQLASHGDPAGLFARLLLLPLPTDYRGDNKPNNLSLPMTIAMQQELEAVMLHASALPQARYTLAPDAMQTFNALKKEAFNMASAAVLSAHSNIYGKRAGYILRMAGALHIAKVACEELSPNQLIPLSTLLLARDIIAHLQAYAITAQSRAAQAAEGSITELMRWIHRFALDKHTSAGRFRADALTPKKRKLYSIQTITSYVQKLVDAGYADWLPGRSGNGGRQFTSKGRLPG